MKLRSMERIALFRRQVIFREWEHRVVSANIEYLKTMLHIIAKCNVSMEFLQIITNWDKIKEQKIAMMTKPTLIEEIVEKKQRALRRNIEKM